MTPTITKTYPSSARQSQHFAGLSLLILTLFFAPTANAHEQGRYTMLETEKGIIRLDKETGAMTTCINGKEGWICTPIKQEKSLTSDNEIIEQLRQENEDLKQRLAEKGGENYKPDGEREGEKSFKLPSDEEVDEAIDYMEKMLRKFGGAMKRLREKQDGDDELEL